MVIIFIRRVIMFLTFRMHVFGRRSIRIDAIIYNGPWQCSLCTGADVIMLSMMASFVIFEELKHLWLLGALSTEASGRGQKVDHSVRIIKRKKKGVFFFGVHDDRKNKNSVAQDLREMKKSKKKQSTSACLVHNNNNDDFPRFNNTRMPRAHIHLPATGDEALIFFARQNADIGLLYNDKAV